MRIVCGGALKVGSKQKRGGSRKGSGRKPLLNREHRLVIGALCEKRAGELQWKAVHLELDQMQLVERLNIEREKLINKAANLNWSRRRLTSELYGLRDRVWGSRNPRYVIKLKRQYGERNEVLRWVAATAKTSGIEVSHGNGARERLDLSPRFVEQCWKEFRQERVDMAALMRGFPVRPDKI